MTVQDRIQSIMQKAEAKRVEREIAILSSSTGEQRFLREKDSEVLNSIKTQIEVAYGKPLLIGYKFDENVETMIAIINALQYAKRQTRELLEPAEGQVDLYQVFDRDLRDMTLRAYGQLPYYREVTTLTMPDGTVKALDEEAVAAAEVGRKANIEALNTAIQIIAMRLGLYADYAVTQEQEDIAWQGAVARVNTAKQLNYLKAQLSV